MTNDAAERQVEALAAWLHEQEIGCDFEWDDLIRWDNGDHSADAAALLAILDMKTER